MDLWQALVLGLVEGLTEYLPVSSTGHLILTERLLGLPDSAAVHAYAICIQAGAILAVLGLYRKRWISVVRGAVGRDSGGTRMLLLLAAAFVPAAVAGVLLDDWIDAHLFGLKPVAWAWIAGALVIFAIGKRLRRTGAPIEQLAIAQAALIGAFQCLALWPGTSRSLATIVGGLAVGLSLAAAVEFSFLLGMVTLLAATAWKALHLGPEMLAQLGAAPIVVGLVVAWLAAVVSVRWMVGWLQAHGLALFGWWRLALGVIVLALLAAGRIA
jgi:undecaprenyl-diphosphatase